MTFYNSPNVYINRIGGRSESSKRTPIIPPNRIQSLLEENWEFRVIDLAGMINQQTPDLTQYLLLEQTGTKNSLPVYAVRGAYNFPFSPIFLISKLPSGFSNLPPEVGVRAIPSIEIFFEVYEGGSVSRSSDGVRIYEGGTWQQLPSTLNSTLNIQSANYINVISTLPPEILMEPQVGDLRFDMINHLYALDLYALGNNQEFTPDRRYLVGLFIHDFSFANYQHNIYNEYSPDRIKISEYKTNVLLEFIGTNLPNKTFQYYTQLK